MMKWMFFCFFSDAWIIFSLFKKWQTFSHCFERDMINAWLSWFYSPTLALLTPDFNLWDTGILFHCQGVSEIIYSGRQIWTWTAVKHASSSVQIKYSLWPPMNCHSGPEFNFFNLHNYANECGVFFTFIIPFKTPCFSLVPTNLT